jgi:hypothetical protein
MSCPREAEVLEQFSAEPGHESGEDLLRHLENCPSCQRTRRELEDMTSRLAADPGEFEDRELPNDVLTLIRVGRAPEAASGSPRRWLRIGLPAAALLASAALLSAIVLAPPRIAVDEHFMARGGAPSEDRWSSIEIFASHPGAVGFERVGRGIRAEDALFFTVTNRPESEHRYLMILAFDDAGRSFWYYPAHLRAGEDPVSIAVARGPKPQKLEDAVRHDLAPGWLRVAAIFSREPLSVKSVEPIVSREIARAGGVTKIERLPIEGTGQQTFLLWVEKP